MKLFKITLSFFTLALLVLSGCVKDDEFFDSGSGEQNRVFIKISEAPERRLFFEPYTGTRDVQIFTLRRNTNNPGDLDKNVVIELKVDTAAITAYNTANSENYKLLPDSLFTLLGNDFTKTGNLTYQTTFASGEFYKDFSIVLNGSKWNLTEKYVFPFTIVDPGGVVLSSGLNKINTFISIKNKWDGRYTMTGNMTDVAVPDLTLKQPTEVHLVTISSNAVEMYNAGTTISSFKFFFPIMNGTSESAYGSFLPQFIFDANNNIVDVVNAYGQPASNTRRAELDPSGINKFDPTTNTIQVKFFMYQPSAVPTGPRTTFDLKFEYLGPR